MDAQRQKLPHGYQVSAETTIRAIQGSACCRQHAAEMRHQQFDPLHLLALRMPREPGRYRVRAAPVGCAGAAEAL